MHRGGISDNAPQRILLATVLWFISNRFTGKSNYPAASHAEEPRIKKHWDLRKIPTRYKSRPPRNLLSLVPVPRSSLAVDRGLPRDPDRSRMIEERQSRFFESGNRRFLTHWLSDRPFSSTEKRPSVYRGISGECSCHGLCRTTSICDELITGSLDRQRKGLLLLPSMRKIFVQVVNYTSRKVSQWLRLRLSEFLERIGD